MHNKMHNKMHKHDVLQTIITIIAKHKICPKHELKKTENQEKHLPSDCQQLSIIPLKLSVQLYSFRNDRDKVFKSGLRKFCRKQPLKNFKGYGLLK